jgi:hypothetical protein
MSLRLTFCCLCSLPNVIVCNSGYVAPHGLITVNSKLEKMWLWSTLEYNPDICLVRLIRNHKNESESRVIPDEIQFQNLSNSNQKYDCLSQRAQ